MHGMLGKLVFEEIGVTFAYGIRSGPITTFQKGSGDFGVGDRRLTGFYEGRVDEQALAYMGRWNNLYSMKFA